MNSNYSVQSNSLTSISQKANSSTFNNSSVNGRKKKTVIVVKKIEPASPKKEVYITRSLKQNEEVSNIMHETSFGNSSPQHPLLDKSGKYMKRSILGAVNSFSQFESEREAEEEVVSTQTPPKSKGSGVLSANSSWRSVGSASFMSNKKPTTTPQAQAILNPTQFPDAFLEALAERKKKALKTRTKEKEKEENLLQYLPVNERFDLNKEGKVLTMWKERQQKWENIQKKLAAKVGGSVETLMMSNGDEFRAKNEEYDVIQAAIPVPERFGANGWQMQLRNGTDTSVSIGHIFSGLTCNIGIHRTVPAIIRKPRQAGAKHLKDTFVDETAALTLKKHHLRKTLQTLRPKNFGPADVDGLILGSMDLFDWAIESSKDYFERVKNAEENEDYAVLFSQSPQKESADAVESVPTVTSGPKLTFQSSRNLVFTGLIKEIVHQKVSFKNTGTTALSYVWKLIPDKEVHEPSQINDLLLSREELPRESVITKERPNFFCDKPFGQILPGDTVETTFSFCCKSSGGVMIQNWMLDTTPRAVINFTSPFEQSRSTSSPSVRSEAARVPSTIAITLRGHVYTLDETIHLRKAANDSLIKTEFAESMVDNIYSTIRRIRQPITVEMLQGRIVELFKVLNAHILLPQSDVLIDRAVINATYGTYLYFVELMHNSDKLFQEIEDRYTTLEVQSREIGYEIPSKPTLHERQPTSSSLIRSHLLPERIIESYDEINEDDLILPWDLNLQNLVVVLEDLVTYASVIQVMETAVNKKLQQLEKQKIIAAKKAADSDYEEEEEEEEEPEEGSAKPSLDECIHVDRSKLLLQQCLEMKESLLLQLSLRCADYINEGLGKAVDELSQLKSKALESSGIKEGEVIPLVPSPFTTAEGKEFWDSILNQVDDPKDKKNAKSGGGKGKGVSDEQRKKYYTSLSTSFFSSIMDNIVDGMMVFNQDLARSRYPDVEKEYESLIKLSSAGQDDFTSGVAFVNANVNSFLDGYVQSAYEASALDQENIINILYKCYQGSVTTVVLLHESDVNIEEEAVSNIVKNLSDQLNGEIQKNLPKKKKLRPLNPKTIDIEYSSSIPQLNARLLHLKQLKSSNGIKSNCLDIIILQNVKNKDLVPPKVEYVEVLSDDEEGPILVGLEEEKEMKRQRWIEGGSQVIPLDIELEGSSYQVTCDTDHVKALNNLLVTFASTWIEADASSCYSSTQGVLHRINIPCEVYGSSLLRQASLWASVLAALPYSTVLMTEDSPLSTFMKQLFQSPRELKFSCCIGGSASHEKFLFIERMIDLAATIAVTGELSIPFINHTRNISFSAQNSELSKYLRVCKRILEKAAKLGVNLIIPNDVVTGDELITPEIKARCYASFDKDARDEGIDYEGESTIIKLDDSISSIIKGAMYDIGPSTLQQIKDEIATTNVLLSWGNIGCCELSSFQAGQKAIVATVLKSVEKDNLHHIVIGDSTVEWWARFADPEGEFGGNLIARSAASMFTRNASFFVGMLLNLPSKVLQRIIRRESPPDQVEEWDYISKYRAVKNEEEEAEEEDEEEED